MRLTMRRKIIILMMLGICSIALTQISVPSNAEDEIVEFSDPKVLQMGTPFVIMIPQTGDDVSIEAQYPGAQHSWIFKRNDNSNGFDLFDMPPSWCGTNITYRSLIWNGSSAKGHWIPSSEWFKINLIGWIDEDDDGLSDLWEEALDLDTDDPNEDADKDGLILLEEMYHLTDPGETDSDHDSMDDLWEATNGTLPFRDDPNDDPDGDTWSNIQEMTKDTDPRDPKDHPVEPPFTPWYWIVIIVGVLVLILAYFVRQLFTKKKLEDDLDDFDRMNRKDKSPRARDISGKI